MKTTLLLEYKYPYGLINSLWSAKDRYGYLPDKIILASLDAGESHTRQVVRMLEAWQQGHGVQPNVAVLVTSMEPRDLRTAFAATLRAEQEAGNEVAVDVTSGRTIPKLALYRAALEEEPDHVFYLDVAGYDYRPQPYPLVPRRIQTCHDLDLEEIHA